MRRGLKRCWEHDWVIDLDLWSFSRPITMTAMVAELRDQALEQGATRGRARSLPTPRPAPLHGHPDARRRRPHSDRGVAPLYARASTTLNVHAHAVPGGDRSTEARGEGSMMPAAWLLRNETIHFRHGKFRHRGRRASLTMTAAARIRPSCRAPNGTQHFGGRVPTLRFRPDHRCLDDNGASPG